MAEVADPQVMQCLEVWGGNQEVDAGVVMAGLDAWVYSRPHAGSANGGDVYYVSSCATGRITRLLVADVCGHGQAVASTAEALRRLMRRYVNHVDQRRFMEGLNRHFAPFAETGGFATAVVATFFAPTGELVVGNAGHPPPLHYDARNRCWRLLDPEESANAEAHANIPLGIAEASVYRQWGLTMEVGDLLLCYTDSLIETRRAGEPLLGTAGLLELVRGIDGSDPERVIPRLLEAIADAGDEADDDVTMLLVHCNGTVPSTVGRDTVLAPARMLGALVSSLRPGGDPMPWPQLSLANLGGALFSTRRKTRR